MLYQKWIDVLKLNKTLQAQILQLNKDKGALEKEVVFSKGKVARIIFHNLNWKKLRKGKNVKLWNHVLGSHFMLGEDN